MFPASTDSPPNFLTPKRLLLLSRPFLEVPCPFYVPCEEGVKVTLNQWILFPQLIDAGGDHVCVCSPVCVSF